jgi:tetratricopeptide (TPR) repeat protein
MPASHTVDIPHVNIHDHYIRKPSTLPNQKRKVTGIAAVNEVNPDALTKTKAWLQYYERFESRKAFLDSAKLNMNEIPSGLKNEQFQAKVHWAFLERNTSLLVQLGQEHLPEKESDAWTAYRLGEAAFQSGQAGLAQSWLKRAVELKPRSLDFQNKYASCLIQNGRIAEAVAIFQELLRLQPQYSPAKVNLGFYSLSQGDDQTAERFYQEALQDDPLYDEALLNQIGLLLYRGKKTEAKKQLQSFIKRYPEHLQARQLLNSL